MKTRVLLGTIFITTFFLCFLGMRNPDLYDGKAPKQRPRAVLEEADKDLSVCVLQQHDNAVVLAMASLPAPSIPSQTHFNIETSATNLAGHPSHQPSRAPPTPAFL